MSTVTVLVRLSLTTLPTKVRLRDFVASVMYRPLFGGLSSALLFDKNRLGAGNFAARRAQRGGVVELLRGFLHAQTEMGFLQGLDLALKASDVFLT
jgi:hypothetical protein